MAFGLLLSPISGYGLLQESGHMYYFELINFARIFPSQLCFKER